MWSRVCFCGWCGILYLIQSLAINIYQYELFRIHLCLWPRSASGERRVIVCLTRHLTLNDLSLHFICIWCEIYIHTV